MKVLVLGAAGMLGNAMFRILSEDAGLDVHGTVRSENSRQHFAAQLSGRIIAGVDAENHDSLVTVFARLRPHVVVNCVGLVKQRIEAKDPLLAVPINTLLPHRLAALCQAVWWRHPTGGAQWKDVFWVDSPARC